ncbi:MAG: hypothetical protein IKO39_01185 [Treponema sp.]|nr:hypothetical protein [Treponema sp.]
MTNEEMKMALAKDGLTAADIEKVSEKYNAEKITEIVEAASTPKEALEALHAFYPELEVEKMQEQMDFVQSQFDAAAKGEKSGETVELTEKELDMVSGGGLGDWFKKNWKKVAVGAAIVVGTALVCTGVGAAIGVAINSASIAAATAAYGAAGVYFGATSAISTGALIGAGVGAAAGGAVVGGLEGTDNLPG